MVFSSPLFVFCFLPFVLTVTYTLPSRARNTFLTLASLLFYAWGETSYAGVMVLSILFNHACARVLATVTSGQSRRWVLGGAVATNLAVLGWFKYTTFLISSIQAVFGAGAASPFVLAPVHLPIGISFFTFHSISYLVDIYRGAVPAQRNVLRTALYVSFFPQLIAGPIIRYKDIAAQIAARVTTPALFLSGVGRFVVGLGKKVLIADMVAAPVDVVFALPAAEVTPGLAWLAVGAYALQIYFDFSGYSDMAIGLARMFGFTFRENFDYPYVSVSVREFWRRWHISLSTWFRDYLYIPLGGGRGSRLRTGLNLLTVFFLCGLWHGAATTFIVWGLWHGMFLVIERTAVGRVLDRLPVLIRHAYTLGVVLVGWVIFRAATLDQGVDLLVVMGGAGVEAPDALGVSVGDHLDGRFLLAAAAGLVYSTPVLPALRRLCTTIPGSIPDRMWRGATVVGLVVIFLASSMAMAAGTYDPFIYFRF